MPYRRQATIRHWRNTFIVFSVALLIAWNFATLAHQFDLAPEHHSQHHCQLFSSAHHGIIHVFPDVVANTFIPVAIVATFEKYAHHMSVRYLARAPPVLT
ncbi:hypothetical protein ACOMICROBIO_GDFFDHBD_00160 [Vibrio sp. B1REV9]|uniref:DUF2607 family protein n=1 Tax=Vibrio sp. B1REV9 TaxID=2751179 RepID=UPI001AFADDFF|nr:DUF2607 family protein [Vibrio sp. B1REV9]CAE6879866.1 hypothetical protein ACOMICROBIO_GDFFDHBD_00160 [Vibrio sp. B1REV9]